MAGLSICSPFLTKAGSLPPQETPGGGVDCRGGVGCPRLAQSPGRVHPGMSSLRFQTQASRPRTHYTRDPPGPRVSFRKLGFQVCNRAGGENIVHGLRQGLCGGLYIWIPTRTDRDVAIICAAADDNNKKNQIRVGRLKATWHYLTIFKMHILIHTACHGSTL